MNHFMYVCIDHPDSIHSQCRCPSKDKRIEKVDCGIWCENYRKRNNTVDSHLLSNGLNKEIQMRGAFDTLESVQQDQKAWVYHNFDDRVPHQPLLGIIEEFGELGEEDTSDLQHILPVLGRLSHSQLKTEQGIRLNEDQEAKAKDAVADIVIFLCDYCSARGWNLSQIVWGVWSQVRKRDWKNK